MKYLTDKESVANVLDAYLNHLSMMGSVPPNTKVAIMLFLFLVDFYDMLQAYFTEEDYKKINCILYGLCISKTCLLPYLTNAHIDGFILKPTGEE